MILVVLAGLCFLSVPLTGGNLLQLSQLRLRALGAPILALLLQVVVVSIVPGGNEQLHADIQILTYVLLGVFLFANRHIDGVPIIAAGAVANALAIVVNGGVMPAARAAQRAAGLVETGHVFHNSAALAHPSLLWLGDIIPVPGPLPNVLSVGDCVIFLGMLVLLHRSTRRHGGEVSPAMS